MEETARPSLISFPTLNSVLQRYAISTGGIRVELPIRPGFSGAVVYRISAGSSQYALRRWANPALNRHRLTALHRLIAWIQAAGVTQVAVPLATTAGKTFVVHDDYVWQLEPWMPGVADYWQYPSREKLADAIETLAAWHRAAKTFPAMKSERKWFRCERNAPSPTVRERLVRIHDWQNGRLDELERSISMQTVPWREFDDMSHRIIAGFRRGSALIADELASQLDIPFDLQPCLRDIWHDHVLFSGNDVTGLIDPTAARLENVATDLARLLGSLDGDDAAAWEFALENYARCNRLSLSQHKLIRTCDRSAVLLNGLTWLSRLYLQRQEVHDRKAVLDRVTRITRRLDVLNSPE